MITPYYQEDWFLALGYLSQGVGWTAHEAALSWVREKGQPRLHKYAVPAALASIPSRLHKVAVEALRMVGLWMETPEGYEVRGAPSPERNFSAVLTQQEVRRESTRAKAAARKRAQRARERQVHEVGSAASMEGSGLPPFAGGPPSSASAREGVTGPVTAPLSRRDIPSLSFSSSSGENFLSGETYSEELGVQGGATAGVTLSVTAPPVTPEVTAPVSVSVPARVAVPVTAPTGGPLSSPRASAPPVPPTPSSAPLARVASSAAKRRPRRPQPEMTQEVREIFEYWREKLMSGAEPIAERIRCINDRLAAGRAPEDIRLAIDGVARSDWHRAKGHIDLTLICRADKFDQYLAWGRGTADPNAFEPNSQRGASRPARTAPPQPLTIGFPKLRWGKIDNEEDFDQDGNLINLGVEEAS
jgi:hypothetical protein